MATCWSYLGVRRRGSRLSANRLAWLLCLPLLAGPGCALFGLTGEQEQAMLDLHRQNAVTYFDAGSYVQALSQADRALALDDELEDMRLVRGFCLLKLGRARGNVALVDEALVIFQELQPGWLPTWLGGGGKTDPNKAFRVQHGLGKAHLARALMHDEAVDALEKRRNSPYLSGAERPADEARRQREAEQRDEHLVDAVRALQKVLEDPRADTAYARIDMVLALNAMGGREQEVLTHGEKALEQLAESNRTWRKIARNPNLSPAAALDADLQVDQNIEKERMLRDLLATVHFNRGDIPAYLAELDRMQARNVMTAVQFYNRAGIHEESGRYPEAISDLESFLRLRARYLDYEEDDMADETFRRIDALRSKLARADRT